MTRRTHRLALASLAVLMAATLAACGSATPDPQPSPTPPAAAPTSTPTPFHLTYDDHGFVTQVREQYLP
jgi:hypothetical protein